MGIVCKLLTDLHMIFNRMAAVNSSCHNHRISELRRILGSDRLSTSSGSTSSNTGQVTSLSEFLFPHLHNGDNV